MEWILFLGYIVTVMIIVLVPLIATIILGVTLANYLHLNGIVWWAFLIVFWCVITGLMSRSSS